MNSLKDLWQEKSISMPSLQDPIQKLSTAIDSKEVKSIQDLIKPLVNLSKDLEHEKLSVILALKKEIYPLLEDFWLSVTTTLPSSDWQTSPRVKPWIDFQEALKKEGWEDADHPQRYQELAKRFSASDGVVNCANVLNLLKESTRMLSYTSQEAVNNYPLGKLTKEIIARKSHMYEKEKQQSIVTMLSILFYIFHHYCTAEQLEILPLLCQYRLLTTDEERLSESATIQYLTQQISASQLFFITHKNYIDPREWNTNANITALATLLPKNCTEFKKKLEQVPWIKILLKQCSEDDKQQAVIKGAKQLLDNFTSLENHSYAAALSFSAAVKRQEMMMSKEQHALINAILYIFCLQVYNKERRNGADRFFGFSGETKCNAAVKKIDEITGATTKFGVWEYLALKQGRLGELVTDYEGMGAALQQ
ncbi:Uncharacterised protein [Legionella hackeliae]|uniref:hypothetical protein n=1 Tax=Legionella hackeliae TaxID=449 RepID=UPI000E13DE83|nr:hypothetical protein [Legionella hackeliae]STX49086.1 Uncharacterised protein [Legionella hackeliae]